MQTAPAVSVTMPTPAWAVAAWALVSAAAFASSLAWAWQEPGPWRAAPPLAAGLLGAFGWMGLRGVGERRLRWDGAQWWLGGRTSQGFDTAGIAPELPGELRVALDVADALLLRFRAAPGASMRLRRSVWLPTHRTSARGDWHALRCALYSPRPVAALSPSGGLHD